jgi:hypothetical protein
MWYKRLHNALHNVLSIVIVFGMEYSVQWEMLVMLLYE